jgi:putative aldouronate transport system permease protein
MNNKTTDRVIFNIISYPLLIILSAICVLPFIIIISSSFTSEQSIISNGYNIIPRVFSILAYKTLLNNPGEIVRAYGISIYVAGVGGILGLFITAMTAYVLVRKSFPWANKFSFFFYFTTLFSGGIVPWYILCVQYLHFKEFPLIAIVLPYLVNVWNLLVMKSFMKSIPEAIIESAKMDGAGDFLIFIRLVLPLSKPILATVGLFISLGYWNDWFLCFMFVDDYRFFSLQYYLYKMITAIDGIQRMAGATNIVISDIPKEGFKMAMTVIATGPVILLYPFVQRYFVKGITIGAVKG